MNFNKTLKTNNKTYSYEGGVVYNKNLEEDWTNLLFSCMLEDKFYENSDTQMERYLALTEQMGEKYGSEFIAKAALFARNEVGIRSIAQLTAARLNSLKFSHKRDFYREFCHRPDDVAETLAACDILGVKRSHAMVRGFGDYLSSLGAYQLDKYKMSNKNYNLYDCINITHAHSANIDKFKEGTLVPAMTWEQRISACSNEEEKANAWTELVMFKSLGYLALIRNLRNILTYNSGYIFIHDYLVPQIVNATAIERSLVYPYQIYNAYRSLVDAGICNVNIFSALEEAFRASTKNMPKLNGKNVIMLDVSGSMEAKISSKSNISIKDCGACYAVAIAIANVNTTIVKFGTTASLYRYNSAIDAFALIDGLCRNDNLGYGTQVDKAFEVIDLNEINADRIFLISDQQCMSSYSWGCRDCAESYEDYVKTYGSTKLYSFDLGNYSTQVANPKNKDVKLFTSLSPKVFDFIHLVENDVSLVDYINEKYNW